MACNPFVESGSYPEAVDTAGNNSQQEPFDPISEETAACACKYHTLAVNNSVAYYEADHIANCPRCGDSAC